jgi:hypothetical protein
MNLSGKKVTLHDMCLRDGMHPKQHLITLKQMVDVATALDAAGVPLIEVTHGDGLGGASVNYGFPAHSDEEYLRAVIRSSSAPRFRRCCCPASAPSSTCSWRTTAASPPCGSPRIAPRPTSPSSTSRAPPSSVSTRWGSS